MNLMRLTLYRRLLTEKGVVSLPVVGHDPWVGEGQLPRQVGERAHPRRTVIAKT